MVPRLALCFAVCCGLSVAAEPGPWSRFFDQPAVSAEQGSQHAMSTAVSSAFNPLKLSVDKSEPPFPPLDKHQLSNTKLVEAAEPGACSIPLSEHNPPKDKYFFIRSEKPQSSGKDSRFAIITKAPPCK